MAKADHEIYILPIVMLGFFHIQICFFVEITIGFFIFMILFV